MQDLRDRYQNLFQAPQGDAMLLFMWQDGIIGVARFIDACLEEGVHISLPWGTRHLISPELAGKDVKILLLFLEDLMALVGKGWRRFKNAQERVLTAKVII